MQHHVMRSVVVGLIATLNVLSAGGVSAADPNFNPSATQLTSLVDDSLASAESLLKTVLSVEGSRTIDNTLRPANDMYVHLSNASEITELFAEVHPDKAVRDAADVGSQRVASFISGLELNRDLYEAYKALEASASDADTTRLLVKTLGDFRRAGVDRDDATREQIKKLRADVVRLTQSFSNNVREDVRSITLDSPSELAGLPDDFIKTHAPGDDGKITITTDYPDYIPFISYAHNARARHDLYTVNKRRGYPQNVRILSKVLSKRAELAQTLGFDNYADYITSDKMIKNAAAVSDFIDRIARMAEKPAAADMTLLLAEKRKDHPSSTKVTDDEKAYYVERVKTSKYSFDSQAARPYFEFDNVRQGLFDVMSKLFGVQFRAVEGLELWHADVTAWDLYDGEKHVGRFMLDLHPRDGKYKHAACFGFHTGIAGKQIPINVLVCNFPNPKASSEPALMEHGQVRTFFHEFGHLLHAMFSGHHDWIGISGISTEWDFVEAPSQMLEEWTWDTDTLQTFARHHETGKPIPTDLVSKMRAARNFGKGMYVRQQMFYAAVSLNFHNRGASLFDTSKLMGELNARYAPCDRVEGTFMHCSFNHLMGYSAIYYTYMWSLVIAKDLFSEFETHGAFNPTVAQRYRRTVLEAGGAKEAARLVSDFLGRAYNFDAYGKWLGSPAGRR